MTGRVLRKLTWSGRRPVRALQGFVLCGGGLLLMAALFQVIGLRPASGWGIYLLGIAISAGFVAFTAAYGARPGESVLTSPMDGTFGEPRRPDEERD